MVGIRRENLYGSRQEKLKVPDSFSQENRKDHAYPQDEFEAGDAVYNKKNTEYRVFNTDPSKKLRLLVGGGIVFVGLTPRWPTPSPYEILET